jgi:hypothetical protein
VGGRDSQNKVKAFMSNSTKVEFSHIVTSRRADMLVYIPGKPGSGLRFSTIGKTKAEIEEWKAEATRCLTSAAGHP